MIPSPPSVMARHVLPGVSAGTADALSADLFQRTSVAAMRSFPKFTRLFQMEHAPLTGLRTGENISAVDKMLETEYSKTK